MPDNLDLAVARAEGRDHAFISPLLGVVFDPYQDETYAPSSNWAQGGPIIERERIEVSPGVTDGDLAWSAWIYGRGVFHHGATPLVAAMRAYVALRGAP